MTEWNETDIAFESGETQETWDRRRALALLDAIMTSPEFQKASDDFLSAILGLHKRQPSIQELWRTDPV